MNSGRKKIGLAQFDCTLLCFNMRFIAIQDGSAREQRFAGQNYFFTIEIEYFDAEIGTVVNSRESEIVGDV